jgi:osmotically-inducible protein OsmY
MITKHPHFHETVPEVETEFPPAAVIEAAVSDALASAGGIDASDVTVTATGTVITLAGTVLQEAEIARAVDVASNVAGVTEIRNALIAKTDINEARGV